MFRSMLKSLQNLLKSKQELPVELGPAYEYCPRCEANLTLQKGYDHNLSYWKCLGCGEMLINPELDADSNIIWFCDGCEAVLNNQQGFNEECGEWKCTECGYVNKIDISELYRTDDEYQEELRNPYRGLTDEEVLELSVYQDEEYGWLETPDNIELFGGSGKKSSKRKIDPKYANVDPDLIEFLGNYEDFVDEYVDFMKKYLADPMNVLSMLNEYNDIMKKYNEFADKINKYDSSKMSALDAEYYLEVTTRCTQKMLNIYN